MTTDFNDTPMHDVMEHLHVDQDGTTAIQGSQFIPGEFLEGLQDERIASQSITHREKNFMKVASIPAQVVDRWHRQGFNIHTMSLKEILKKLKDEDMNGLIATSKRIG